MSLYLGVDGGQSSTVALIADESGRVVGSGRGGPCNHVKSPEGRTKFLRVLGECLRQATRECCETRDGRYEFAAACLGLSGGAEDKIEYVHELISTRLLKTTHDAEIALTGATEGAPGIVVIAGTGSIAFGRNAQGRTGRAGGWGYVFGDEGGGFDLARRALRAALQWEEGWGPDTALHSKLLEKTGARSANKLMHELYGGLSLAHGEVATLARLVDEAAGENDAVAQAILLAAARALAWYAQGVYESIFSRSETVPVAYIGGVFNSTQLTHDFSAAVDLATGCKATAPRLSPAAGALLEALRLDGNNHALRNVPGTKT